MKLQQLNGNNGNWQQLTTTMTGLVERVDCSLAMAMDSVTQDTQGVSPWDDNVDRK